jgi:hypothetical protein
MALDGVPRASYETKSDIHKHTLILLKTPLDSVERKTLHFKFPYLKISSGGA